MAYQTMHLLLLLTDVHLNIIFYKFRVYVFVLLKLTFEYIKKIKNLYNHYAMLSYTHILTTIKTLDESFLLSTTFILYFFYHAVKIIWTNMGIIIKTFGFYSYSVYTKQKPAKTSRFYVCNLFK